MKGINKIFDTKYGGLVFSLFSGCAYFIIILDFFLKSTTAGGGLLGFFFFPAIVCGTALVILKLVKRLQEEEQYGKINLIVYMHIALAIISIVFLFDMVL